MGIVGMHALLNKLPPPSYVYATLDLPFSCAPGYTADPERKRYRYSIDTVYKDLNNN